MALFSTAAVAGFLGLASTSFVAIAATGILNVAVGIGVNKIATRLAGKRGQPAAPAFALKGTLQRGADIAQSIILGDYATAGTLTYANEWGVPGGAPRAYVSRVISLSDYPCSALTGLWVQGKKCTIGATPHADYGHPVEEFNTGGQDHLWVKFYDGTQTAADNFLVGTVSTPERPWQATAVGRGIAYVIVTTLINQELFKSLEPPMRFEVSGAKLYDPTRDSTVGGAGPHRWDDPGTWGGDGDRLPAVMLYNLLRGIRWGGLWLCGLQAVSAAQLPVGHWIDQINACRAAVTAQAGPEATYRAGGELSLRAKTSEAVQALLDACNGKLSETGGSYKLSVGGSGASVASFSDADIMSTAEQTFTPFFGLAQTVNGINGRYPDPAQGWETETAPPLTNAALEAEDGNRRLMVDADYGMVPYPEQVQRLMRAALNEARRARRHTFTLPPKFWPLEPGDVITWTASERNGYVNKLFRVDGVLDRPDADVVVDITEIDPSDYDFNTAVDFTPVGGGSVAPRVVGPQPFVGWNVTQHVELDDTGTARLPAIKVQWNPAVEDVAAILVKVRRKSTGETVFSGRFDDVAAGVAVISQGIVRRVDYEVSGVYIPRTPRTVAPSAWLDITAPDVEPEIGTLSPETFAAIYADAEALARRVLQISGVERALERLAQTAISDQMLSYTRHGAAIAAIDQVRTTSATATEAVAETLTDHIAVYDENAATVSGQITGLSNADAALALSVGALSTTVNGHTATIAEQTQSISGLSASYNLTIDNNGAITGFGLYSDIVAGNPTSGFIVRSDMFALVAPDGSGQAVPFTVYTTPRDVNGVTLPAGSYMTGAYIQDLSAVVGTIGTLRTRTTGERTEISDNVIKVFDANNVVRVKIGDLSA